MTAPSNDSFKQLSTAEKNFLEKIKDQTPEYKEHTEAGPVDHSRYQHSYTGDEDAKSKNFDQKIYMFPESFNALRRELCDYWPHLWSLVSKDMGTNAQRFVYKMNQELETSVQFDTARVDSICQFFLTTLQNARKQYGH